MADFNTLIADIRAAIYENTEQAITGDALQDILLEMVTEMNTAKADQGDLDTLAGVVAGKQDALTLAAPLAFSSNGALILNYSGHGITLDADGNLGVEAGGGLGFVDSALVVATGDGLMIDSDSDQLVASLGDGLAFDASGAIVPDFTFVQAAIPDLAEIRQNAASPLHWLTGEAQEVEEGRVYTGTGILAAPGEFEVIKCYAVNYTNTAQTITCWRYPDTASNAQTFTLAPFQVLALTCTIDEPQGSIWTAADSHYQREPELYPVTYGLTTYQEIVAACNAGKVPVCFRDNRWYILSTLDLAGHAYFSAGVGTQVWRLRCRISDSVWGTDYVLIEISNNKLTTTPTAADLASTSKYPSMASIAPVLGRRGKVSQTITWSGSGAGATYALSNITEGVVPQELINQAAVYGVTFNTTTGYFEYGGYTDIAADEMREAILDKCSYLDGNCYMYYKGRIILPARTSNAIIAAVFANASFIKEIPQMRGAYSISIGGYVFNRCWKLEAIRCPIVSATAIASSNFTECTNLHTLYISNLANNADLSPLSVLSMASVAYAINNSAGTNAKTITLHPDVYAAAQTDADVQAALVAKPLVTLVSA